MRFSTFGSCPVLATLVIATLGACPGPTGHDGPAVRMRTSTINPGLTCAHGGTLLEYGLDDGAGAGGSNGELDSDEIDGSTPVCNGATGPTGEQGSPGHASLIAVDSDVGAACSAFGNRGGQRIRAGTDDGSSPDDGVLQDDEVDAEKVLCNGATGAGGPAGSNCWDAIEGGTSAEDCIDSIAAQVSAEAKADALRIGAASAALSMCAAQGTLTGGSLDVAMIAEGTNGDVACDRIANGGQDWCCKNVNIIYPDPSPSGLDQNEGNVSFTCDANFPGSSKLAYAYACCLRGADCP